MIGSSLKALGLTSAALVAATFAVFAQTAPSPGPGPADVKGKGRMAACRADMKSLCGDVDRAKGARMRCLVENRAKASPECQATIAAVEQRMGKGATRQARKQARLACQADAEALCGTEANGNGRIMRCLRQNEAKVSPDCATALAALPMRKRGPAAPAAPMPQ